MTGAVVVGAAVVASSATGCLPRKTKAEREKEVATATAKVTTYFAKLNRIEEALTADTPFGRQCPAKLDDVPVIDYYTLDALARDGKTYNVSRMIISDPFQDLAPAKAKLSSDAGYSSSIEKGANAVDKLDTSPHLVVLWIDKLKMPKVTDDGFSAGSLDGRAFVFDTKTEKIVCGKQVSAQSSDTIQTGGGMKIKVKGVPLGTVGGTSATEAVEADFKANLARALRTALGGSS